MARDLENARIRTRYNALVEGMWDLQVALDGVLRCVGMWVLKGGSRKLGLVP